MKVSKQVEKLKGKLRKSKINANIWKYAYQNKVTEFFKVAESIRIDFFKNKNEVKNFIQILKKDFLKPEKGETK